ncbi:MAG: alanine--glyoxylate aminotransferase family protein [Hyphomicrobiales bacterium]|nr:alanine--glyoxylate aminotransferase family protein [Hyphomicrobiales bacterium]
MSALLPDVDPGGLSEFSVVFTDRSLNHMSQSFQQVMRDISQTLKSVYKADAVAVVPGGGTYAMEAVARQIATGKKCLVIRNGWFSFRWTQIFDAGSIPSSSIVLKARRQSDNRQEPFTPPPIEEVVATIKSEKPDLVFAPHVETSSGMILPEGYMKAIADAIHEVDGLFVLDCIASGTVWLDMKDIGIDVLISAPQKGWSASPAAGLVMMNENAENLVSTTSSTSFACDLKKWLEIMNAFENGGHAYHATMPTDALVRFRDIMKETEEYGFDKVCQQQLELGFKVRELLTKMGVKSVAAKGFEAPGVVVVYTDDPDLKNGSKFVDQGMQIAAGVPLQCDEPADFQTFRLGLFGLDKLNNIDATVARLKEVLDKVI